MITKDNYEAMLVMHHEGLLDERQQKEVELFLQQHPEIADEYRTYYSDEHIATPLLAHYPDKEKLKRKRPTAMRWWLGAAACLAAVLMAGIWMWPQAGDKQSTTPLTANTESNPLPTTLATKDTGNTAAKPLPNPKPQLLAINQMQHLPAENTSSAIAASQSTEASTEPQPIILDTAMQKVLSPTPIQNNQLVIMDEHKTINNNLVITDEERGCTNLACRLIVTGQRLGML